MSITPINGLSQQLSPIQSMTSSVGKIGGQADDDKKQATFSNILKSHLNGVNQVLHDSVESKNALVRGELKNTHDTAIAGMKAGVMLRLTTAVMSKASSGVTTLFQMQL